MEPEHTWRRGFIIDVMAHYYSKPEWEKLERRRRPSRPRQEPARTPAKKRRLTLQPFSLIRNCLPYRAVPAIILKGLWLEDAGFHIRDKVTITVHEKKLIIQLNKD